MEPEASTGCCTCNSVKHFPVSLPPLSSRRVSSLSPRGTKPTLRYPILSVFLPLAFYILHQSHVKQRACSSGFSAGVAKHHSLPLCPIHDCLSSESYATVNSSCIDLPTPVLALGNQALANYLKIVSGTLDLCSTLVSA